MSNASFSQKVGVVARVAAKQARASRTLAALTQGATTAARAFGAVLHQLWLEVIGIVFLAMAAVGAVAVVRESVKYEAGHAAASRVVVAICFTLTFAWFGVSSFLRVGKKRS